MKPTQVFLWGLPGSGKSSVGRLLAKRLKRRFVDLDLRLQRELKMSISLAFERLGEARFRAAETRVLRKLDLKRAWVVAGGGGLALKAANRAWMHRQGVSIHLRAGLRQIWTRLGRDGVRRRPLLAQQGIKALRELARKRKKIYALADFQVNALGSPAQISAKIEKILKKRAY